MLIMAMLNVSLSSMIEVVLTSTRTRYGPKAIPAGTRFATPQMSIYSDVMNDANFDKLEKWEAFSKERGHTVGELAIHRMVRRLNYSR